MKMQCRDQISRQQLRESKNGTENENETMEKNFSTQEIVSFVVTVSVKARYFELSGKTRNSKKISPVRNKNST